MSRKAFTREFKIESARLILEQGYSISEACAAMRRWVAQLNADVKAAHLQIRPNKHPFPKSA